MKIFIVLALVACAAAFKLPPAYKQLEPGWKVPSSIDDSDRIVGGSNAAEKEFPFIVSVREYINWHYTHSCGGTILRYDRILTAAHCVDGVHQDSMNVMAGQLRVNSDTDDHEQYSAIDSVVKHHSYNSYSNDYDFAILKLRSKFSYTGWVKSIRMGSVGAGEWVYVAGWGRLSEGGAKPDHLQKLSVPILSDADCKKAYPNEIYDSMMCAGFMTQTGKDSCNADSGGPLTRGTGSTATLVGVVSWGDGCARYGKPGVYGRVSKIESWASGIAYN